MFFKFIFIAQFEFKKQFSTSFFKATGAEYAIPSMRFSLKGGGIV